MESIYRSILKQAVNIARKFKYLWFFGLFAALAGNGGIYNIGINNFDKVESQGIFLNDLKEGLKNLQFRLFNWEGIWTNISFWEVIFLVVILAVVVFLIWLSFSSQGALVWGIRQALGGKITYLERL